MALSFNGRYAVLTSRSTNVPGINAPDDEDNVYRYDRETGLLSLLSAQRLTPADAADGESTSPSISGNGSVSAFSSIATDLVHPPLGTQEQHVWAGIAAGGMSIASRASGASGDVGNGPSDRPALSHTGRHVAFESAATNLIGSNNDTNGKFDIFARDRISPFPTVRVSVSTSGTQADDHSYRPAISATGRFVAFESLAGNLANGSTQGTSNIFIRDRDTVDGGTFDDPDFVNTARISVAASGEPTTIPNGESKGVNISGNGVRLVYETLASNITPSGQITSTDYSNVVFATYNPITFVVTNDLVTKHHTNNVAANGDHINVHISANGKWLTFVSNSSELHSQYSSQAWRVYIVRIHEDNGAFTFEIVRVIDGSEVSSYEPDADTRPVIAGTGRFIAFDMKHTGTEPRQVFVHENARMLGDLNGDGNIGVADLLMLLANWCPDDQNPACGCLAYDLNGDGKVDDDDKDILLENWG